MYCKIPVMVIDPPLLLMLDTSLELDVRNTCIQILLTILR